MIFILTYEYSDKSGFKVCGVTQNPVVATAWREANMNSGENHVRVVNALDVIVGIGLPDWDYK